MQAFIGHIKKAPHFLVDNEFIQRGYRINFNSKRRLCRSLFMLHNESVNVWSHLIGVACFIGLLIWTIIALSPISSYISIGDPRNINYSEEDKRVLKEHSVMESFKDFEGICESMLNISIANCGLTE